ncbi:MAG: DUF4399 domain-containing protein [Sandaracinaceae bacterium]
MRRHRVRNDWVLGPVLFALACGGGGETHSHEEQADPEAEGHGEPAEGEGLPPLPAVPAGARVMFVSPTAGATVAGPLEDGKVTVHVEMGVEGMRVQPAADGVQEGTGHHHIIVDGEGVPVGEAVPADDTHIHFGGGQTETDLALAPGEHTLTLQFADGLHRSYGPAMSSQIPVTVAAEDAAAEAE